tara:strand:- start:244 stop:684 length:441 start_codon:yes stop_codon:yes gene_type:complete
MVKKSIVQVLLIVLIGCSPQKQLNRIIEKNPHLTETDTIRVVDTVVVNNYSFDTINRVQTHDTIIIQNNERVEARYFYDTVRQEIWHEIECKNDTIFQEKLIPVDRVVYKELTMYEKYKDVALIIVCALILLFIILVALKVVNKFI